MKQVDIGSFLTTNNQREPPHRNNEFNTQIVDHVSIPVVAAGGVMDGRGILASTRCKGVQMGTA